MQFSAEIWCRSGYIQALGDFSKLIGEKSPIWRQRVKYFRRFIIYTVKILAQNQTVWESESFDRHDITAPASTRVETDWFRHGFFTVCNAKYVLLNRDPHQVNILLCKCRKHIFLICTLFSSVYGRPYSYWYELMLQNTVYSICTMYIYELRVSNFYARTLTANSWTSWRPTWTGW